MRPDDLLLNTGTARVGNSGALDIGSGLSASGLGGSIAISVGSGTDIGGAFSVMAGNLLGASGGDASIVSGLSATSSSEILTLALGDGHTSRGAVTIDNGDGSTASGGSITISLGIGMATNSSRLPFLASVWLLVDEMQVMRQGYGISEICYQLLGDYFRHVIILLREKTPQLWQTRWKEISRS
jgi:hypothetical protein